MFVNDALGFRMSSEVVLYYSRNCYGAADAISYRDDVLRIHDLKTGIGRVSMDQLKIYAALFMLEYDVSSYKDIVLCIYQNDSIIEEHPSVEEITDISKLIIRFDQMIEEERHNEGLL